MVKAAADAAVQLPEGDIEIGKRLEQALPLLRSLGLDAYELQAPRCVLAWCGYFADRRFGFVYDDEALACAQEVCGMNRARRLSRWLGRRLDLMRVLAAHLKGDATRRLPSQLGGSLPEA